MAFDDRKAGEEDLEMCCDQLFDPDKACLATGLSIACRLTELCGEWDEPWQHLGYLHAGEELTLLGIAQHDGEVQAQVGDEGEGATAIKSEGGEDREDLAQKVVVEPGALLWVELVVVVEGNTMLVQLGEQFVQQQVAFRFNEWEQGLAHTQELFAWRESIG